MSNTDTSNRFTSLSQCRIRTGTTDTVSRCWYPLTSYCISIYITSPSLPHLSRLLQQPPHRLVHLPIEERLSLLQSPSLNSPLTYSSHAYWYTGFPFSSFRYSAFRPPRAITSVVGTVLNVDFTSMKRITDDFPSQFVHTTVPIP